MHIMIYFLNYFDLRCSWPMIITPIIPDMMGLPPTMLASNERFCPYPPNHGLSI